MGGSSVNLKFQQELGKHQEELGIEEKMIDIGTCVFHVVPNAFNVALRAQTGT